MIRAVVFDFDGLILDTETHEFAAWQQLYRDHGAELTLEVWGTCVGTGPGVFNPYEHLETCIGRKLEQEELRKARTAGFEARMREEQVRPGVREYVKEAKRLGLRIGLASSSSKVWVTGYLSQHGLMEAFECIRTADDVKAVKPDPELYLQVLENLGVRPEEAVAFEDSPNGALAAKRAGMYCVAVPNSVTGSLLFGKVDMRLGSMAERPLLEVIAQLEAAAREQE